YFEEFSSHGKYGSVVELEDVANAAKAIMYWLSKNDKLNIFSEISRKYILENHSIEQEVIGINKAYLSLLKD
ncbi:glycosyltransferase family 1 protein, partial [Amylibacter sp.]|nr:glycosyltransferase family 1 protein [Amylibacter sp.]